MKPPSPARDWAAAIIGILFVAGGLFVLRTDRDAGIATIALFGVCAAMAIARLRRGRRARRTWSSEARVQAGTPIRPPRVRIVLYGAGCLGLGAILFTFDQGPSPILRWIGAGLMAVGGAVLGAVATGHLPNQHLEFRADGLLFAFRGWSVLLPWDRLRQVSAGEYSRNPALFLWLDAPETMCVTPPDRHASFMKYVKQSRGWMGADIVLLTTQFNVDLPILEAVIQRYRTDPGARRELAPEPSLSSASALEG